MNKYIKYASVILTALVMSVISSKYLFVGSVLNLIPWGIITFLWAILAKSKLEARKLAALYGFAQAFIFLWVDKKGSLGIGQFLLL
jgi:hypothetical protein